MNRWAPAALVTVLASTTAAGQPRVVELEGRLPSLTGAARAHALSELTGLLNNDNPRRAIATADEALAWYAGHPEPSIEARTLAEVAWAHMIVGDMAGAIASAEKGRDLAKRHGDEEGMADAINCLGVIAQRRGDAVEAVGRFGEALELYRRGAGWGYHRAMDRGRHGDGGAVRQMR
jgi:hypothetical protein